MMLESTTESGGLTKRKQDIEKVIDAIDAIDPDSCDFEPLTKSINGAALTDLSIHDEIYTSDYNKSSSFDMELIDTRYVSISGTEEFQDYDHDHPTTGNTIFRKVVMTLFSILPLSPQSMNKIGGWIDTFTLHFYAPVNSNNNIKGGEGPANLSELSEASAAMVCVVFAIIIILSGIIAAAISHITGIGPERNIAVVSQSFFYRHNRISPQGVGLAPPIGTNLPSAFANNDIFSDVDDLPLEYLDTPIFWHIPRSAGTSMKSIFSSCLGKVIATEVGGLDEHRLDDRIVTIKKPNGLFVNVDLYTVEGITRAKNLGLVQSNLAEAMFTPFIHESSVLFDKNHRGRLFTIMRHPVDRIISLYYFLRIYDNNIKKQSIDEFVRSSGQNWMVRTLTGTMTGPIDQAHLHAAKEMLRRKFLVGTLEKKTESFRRFEEYFKWNVPSPRSDNCKNDIFYFNWHVKNPHPMPEIGDAIYAQLERINVYDIAIYEYAQQLFDEQAVMFSPTEQKE
jgi:hypothetical protein